MITPNSHLHEICKFVTGLAPVSLGGSGEDGVSLKNYSKLTVILLVKNGSAATGAAVTLKQSLNVALGTEKALAFSKMWANIDTAATDTLVETAVTANTFDTDSTNSKDLMYVMEVDATDLDQDLVYTTVRLDVVALTDAVLSIQYILWPSKFADAIGGPTAILD